MTRDTTIEYVKIKHIRKMIVAEKRELSLMYRKLMLSVLNNSGFSSSIWQPAIKSLKKVSVQETISEIVTNALNALF